MSPMKVILPSLITRMYYTEESEINVVEISLLWCAYKYKIFIGITELIICSRK